MISGKRASRFREGWALPFSFNSRKGHYFIRTEAGLVSARCGALKNTPAGRLFELGTFQKCSMCENLVKKGLVA